MFQQIESVCKWWLNVNRNSIATPYRAERPLFSRVHSSPRDNLSKTKISRKAHFTRVTEVVESCQMCWNLHLMQQRL